MSNPAQFIGKPVSKASLPEWAREQLPPKGTAKRIRNPDRPRGLSVMEAIENNYVNEEAPSLLYQWSKRKKRATEAVARRQLREHRNELCQKRNGLSNDGPPQPMASHDPRRKRAAPKGLPGLGGEILDRWYEYEVTADGRVLRFMVFSADQLKRSKESKTLRADALRKTRGITDREFMEQHPELFLRENGSLPRRRPTTLFNWRDKKYGCPYLGGRILNHWREHGRIVNDPDDVKAIVKRIRETEVNQWTDPTTGRTFTPIPLAEFRHLTGMVEQEVAQYRDKRPHPALGRKIDFMKGKRSGGRTRLGMGYRYSREDGEKLREWYEAKANGKVGKPVEAAAFINNLVGAGPVKAGDGTKKVLHAGFSDPTLRKGFKLSNAVSSRVGEDYYWHHKDTPPPSDVSMRQRAIQFLKKLLPKETVVKASDGMQVFRQAGFTSSMFYAVWKDAGLRLTFLGIPGPSGLHVWHSEGTDPKCEPLAPDAIAALLANAHQDSQGNGLPEPPKAPRVGGTYRRSNQTRGKPARAKHVEWFRLIKLQKASFGEVRNKYPVDKRPARSTIEMAVARLGPEWERLRIKHPTYSEDRLLRILAQAPN